MDEQGCAVLTSFGHARVIGDPAYNDIALVGSAAYIAPELLLGEVNVDQLFSKKSDIYALGMLCFKVSLMYR